MKRQRGFTLVELLVVIGLIAVLISLLLPALRQVRSAALQARCASRMRAVGQAFAAYEISNDGAFPHTMASGATGSFAWIVWQPLTNIEKGGLARYMGLHGTALADAFRCPATFLDNQMGFEGGRPYPLTFTMNCWYLSIPQVRTIQTVINPSQKILVYDENENADDDQFWYATDRDTIAGRHGNKSIQVADVNGGGTRVTVRYMGNALFMDGHVELVDNNMCHARHYNDPSVP